METTQKDRDAFRVALNSAFFLDLPATRALLNDADRLAAIERRLRMIDVVAIWRAERCAGCTPDQAIEAIDNTVRAILDPEEGS